MLLAGDHPSFSQFPLADNVPLSGITGEGNLAGVIEANLEANDMFRFDVPVGGADFVTIRADAQNSASTLNTRLDLYTNNNGSPVLVRSSSGDGVLTAGTPTDAWIGFVALENTTYYVKVSSDVVAGQPGSTGAYVLRIDRITEKPAVFIAADPPPADNPANPLNGVVHPATDAPGKATPIVGTLGPGPAKLLGDDIVYAITVPTGHPEFDGITSINAAATSLDVNNRLDTRLDIFDASGNPIAISSPPGRLNDAFSWIKTSQGQTFFVRVRSDEFVTGRVNFGTGDFELNVDVGAQEFSPRIDTVTRRAQDPDDVFVLDFQTALYRFQDQATGPTIVSAIGTGLAPLQDPALRLIDSNGALVAFNNDFAGPNPQVVANLTGGQVYYIVLDGFSVPNIGLNEYALFVESDTTFNTNSGSTADDHPNTPPNPLNGTADTRRTFEAATPLVWGAPYLIKDAAGNYIQDSGWLADAEGWGRIHPTGDTDLFSFVPTTDSLGTYPGSNSDAGTSLYVGGSFLNAGTVTRNIPNVVNRIAAWDAGDYWPARLGLNGNIFAMAMYDPPPGPGGDLGPMLIVGGDFTMAVNGPDPVNDVVMCNHIAAFGFSARYNDFAWLDPVKDGTNLVGTLATGTVRAMAVVDLPDVDGSGPGGDLPPLLVFGGDFGRILQYDGASVSGFQGMANNAIVKTGGTPSVHAITQYIEDYGDPDDTTSASNPQPDPPASVAMAIGGDFTSVAGKTANNIARFGSDYSAANPTYKWFAMGGTTAASQGLTGVVNALLAFDPEDPDGNGPLPDPPPGLIVGGLFSQGHDNAQTANDTTTLNNIAYWDGGWFPPGGGGGNAPANWIGTSLGYKGWNALGGAGASAGVTGGAVNTLAAWDPADPDGAGPFPDFPNLIVAGGAFTGVGPNGATAAQGIVSYNINAPVAQQGWLLLANTGVNGTVNAISVLSDTDVGITADPLLYIGGSFTNLDGTPMNSMARFTLIPNVGYSWEAMNNGPNPTANATNPFPTENGVGIGAQGNLAPAVFALAAYDDGNPATWDRNDRPSARVNLVVAPDFEGFVNTSVRLFDSNFNLIYTNDDIDNVPGWSSQLGYGSAFPFDIGRSGGIDPSREFPGARAASLPPLWAGERYYLEISNTANTGVGVGRYFIKLTADTHPPLVPTPDTQPNGGNFDPAQAGDFINAYDLAPPGGTGDATNFNPNPTVAPITRTFNGGASSHSVAFLTEYGNIYALDETDLYVFRAEGTGYVEVRLNTQAIPGEFREVLDGQVSDPINPDGGTFRSPLDGALRIFDGDFTQIAYNNDNPAVSGDPGAPQLVGTLAAVPGLSFTRLDPRVVFPVVEGNFYYIQVENGQKWVDGAPADPANRVARKPEEIDYRHFTGAYQLLLNAMSDLDPVTDDHSDTFGLSTPVPIGDDPADPSTNGKGFIAGTINNGTDVDVFQFIAPARGTASITVQRTAGSNVLPDVGIFEFNPITNGFDQIAGGTASSSGSITLQVPARPGEQFFIAVQGNAATTGAYTVAISGMPYADDVNDVTNLPGAPVLVEYDFLGSAEQTGTLEQAGDTDVYRFSTDDYATMTVRVDSLSAQTLNPYVTVYEVNVDPAGNPSLWRIAFNDDVSAGNHSAQASFSTTPSRVYGPTGQAFPYYYVVVSGSDPTADYGDYKLSLTFPPTDDHPDAGQYGFAHTISVDPATGAGTIAGRTETLADTDLFQFTAPAGGVADVIVTRPVGSVILPKVSVIQLINGAPVVLATGTASEVGPNFNPADTGLFNVVRGQVYFVLVENTGGRNGQYTVSVTAPAVDDYPNEGEFSIAALINLNALSGDASVGTGVVGDPSNPTLSPPNDTDLFYFVPVRTGPASVTLISFAGALGRYAPRLRIFNAAFNLISDVSSAVVPTPGAPTPVTFATLQGADLVQGQKYYVLVSAVAGLPPPATLTGEYQLNVNTTGSSGGGDPGAIDFNNPDGVVQLDPRTGDGQITDLINVPGDRDLFTWTIPQGVLDGSPVFVQVVTPAGGVLDAGVTILDQPNEQSIVTTDSAGIPGATASVRFTGHSIQYWAIVTGLSNTGAYTLRVNTEPTTQFLYYPEGFASPTIREFLSISNNNTYDVKFSIVAYYEDSTNSLPPTVIVSNAVITAGARSGVTTSDAANGTVSGLRQFVPYALVLESNGPLGATLAHYDFGSTVGDALTERVSPTWTFARVERNPGIVQDFLLFYNPNPFDVVVTATAYPNNGAPIVIDLGTDAQGNDRNVVHGNRRMGLSIQDLPQLPPGQIMGFTITSHAKDPANNAAFIGIVASLSHYNAANTAGFGNLGDPDGGSTRGAAPSLTNSATVQGEIVLFNPTNTTANVVVRRTYLNGLPFFETAHTLPGHATIVLVGAGLQMVDGQPAGITYTSNIPIVMQVDQTQLGDADSTQSATSAGTEFFLSGDGFMNEQLAGQMYFETVNLYNPTSVNTVVVVKLLFTGTSDFLTVNVNVAARGFAQLKLHELQALLTRPGILQFYSVEADSIVPVVATMTHYDLFLGGGWTTSGVPLGLTNDLTSIPG